MSGGKCTKQSDRLEKAVPQSAEVWSHASDPSLLLVHLHPTIFILFHQPIFEREIWAVGQVRSSSPKREGQGRQFHLCKVDK